MSISDDSSDQIAAYPAPRKYARKRPPGVPDPVDIHVGSRVRLRRTLLGLSQEKLGEAIGLTFQQIQKYERGANRIGASRLYDLSNILDVPVSYFYDEMPDDVRKREIGTGLSSPQEDYVAEKDPLTRRETLELVRAYYKVSSARVRKQLFELVKSLGKADAGLAASIFHFREIGIPDLKKYLRDKGISIRL